MNISYSNQCALLDNPTKWVPATLDSKGNHFVVTNLDRTVLSIQPDGSQQTRPAGTDAEWEGCTVDPSINVLHFSGTGIPYQVVYKGR